MFSFRRWHLSFEVCILLRRASVGKLAGALHLLQPLRRQV